MFYSHVIILKFMHCYFTYLQYFTYLLICKYLQYLQYTYRGWLIPEYLLGFFSFLWLKHFLKYFFCMIVWFWYQIIISWFGYYRLDVCMFSHIFYGFSKNCIVHRQEKIFFKFIFCFFFTAIYSYQCMVFAKLSDWI